MPDGERERVFLPFYRAGNADRGNPEGLGLAISPESVEAHGGHL